MCKVFSHVLFKRLVPYVERAVVTVSMGSFREEPQRNRFLKLAKYLKSVTKLELECAVCLYTLKQHVLA
jgi:hypothetical protein